MGIVHKALHDGLNRRGAYLPPDRYEDAASFMLIGACKTVLRFDPSYGQALSTFVYRRTRPRLIDWYRMVLGDPRHASTFEARHAFHFADRYEDELDGVTYELDDDEHDLDRAEEELGRGLSEQARRGLHLYRLDEEHGHRVYAGNGSERARKAVKSWLLSDLEQTAKANDRSMSAEVRRALTAYLASPAGSRNPAERRKVQTDDTHGRSG